MNKFSLVMFDLDGTLLNTLEDLADAVNSALAANAYPTHHYDAYYNYIGGGAYNLITQVLPEEQRIPDIIDKVHSEFTVIYARNCAVKTSVYPGVLEALKRIAATGVDMAVLSNKPDRYMEGICMRYFSEIEFKAFRGKRDGVPTKPDPAGAQLIAQECRLSLDNAIYVGDSSVDIQTAENTGMFSCGVLWGFRTKEELMSYGAGKLVETPAEMADFIIQNV